MLHPHKVSMMIAKKTQLFTFADNFGGAYTPKKLRYEGEGSSLPSEDQINAWVRADGADGYIIRRIDKYDDWDDEYVNPFI